MISSNANGTSVSYTWDSANQLATVMDNWTGGQSSYMFDQSGQLSSVAYPNGVNHNYTNYDARDRLTNLSVSGSSGALASYVQAFSFSGRKTSAAEANGRTANYGYDTIYRLLNESVSGDPTAANNGVLSYTLDPVGNRQSLNSTLTALASQSFTYDADDRISGDLFDTNGNTLTSGGHAFSYDFADRLTQFDNTVLMAYDGDGNRATRTQGGTTIRYLIDEQTPTGYPQIAEEVLVGTGVIRAYTYGVMRVSQRLWITGTNWQLSYFGYDGGGSVRQLTDPTGAVTDTYAYDAFGNTVAQAGSTFNQFLYRGEQFDSTLGMYYLRARYYRPQVGRFLTADKYEGPDVGVCECAGRANRATAGSHHLFAYTGDDPVNLEDPSGYGGRIFSYSLLLSSLILRVAPVVERAGLFVRGQLSLGVSSILRAGYFHDLLFESNEIAGEMRTVASGVFQNLQTGVFIRATAISQNLWTRALLQAAAAIEETVVKFPFDKAVAGSWHAEQILLAWAQKNGYAILSIAPAGKVACELYCQAALAAASAAQYASLGFPIFYY